MIISTALFLLLIVQLEMKYSQNIQTNHETLLWHFGTGGNEKEKTIKKMDLSTILIKVLWDLKQKHAENYHFLLFSLFLLCSKIISNYTKKKKPNVIDDTKEWNKKNENHVEKRWKLYKLSLYDLFVHFDLGHILSCCSEHYISFCNYIWVWDSCSK